MRPDVRFLYLHVPKTGGVSFRTVLEDSLRADETLHVVDTEGTDAYDPADLAPYRFVHGHFRIHQIAHLDGFVRVVSLRDPVERCLSIYDFWRAQDPASPQWSAIGRAQIEAAHALPLEALCSHSDPEIAESFNDHQTRLLCGETDPDVAMGPEHLARTLATLARFDVVALTHQLDVATLLLCLRFGLFCPDQPVRLNVTPRRTAVSDAQRTLLERHNPMDRQLLRHLEGEGPVRLARLDPALVAGIERNDLP